MEFVQFHPTGMVWPISVRGILVTEGVRGEGGVLRNSEGRRFMFDEIPDLYKAQTADTEEEGWRYTQGDKNARRPPELLTRDHVARCINREVKAGRGSPHGGVYLDIAWIKQHIPKAAEHIKRKLPSMYHQFKQLADIDITKEPMEVGPTTHYMMGGIRVDGDSQMSTVPGLFAAGEAAAGLHGCQPPGRQFTLRPAGIRQARRPVRRRVRPTATPPPRVDEAQMQAAASAALEPFERGPVRRESVSDPVRTAGDACRIWSASCAPRARWNRRSTRSRNCARKAAAAGIAGHRQYNNGWHTAMDLANMLEVSEAITRAALLRKESRGAQFREDFPNKDPEWGKHNIVVRRGADGEMLVEKRPLPPMPDELKQIIEEMK